jgi:hypothetical protein
MKTCNLLLITFLTILVLKCFGQNSEFKGIEYLIPNTVKTKILEAMRADKPDANHYLIWSTRLDTTSMMVSNYSQSSLNTS